ncbi:SDR family NAD(P)-dependent oxidoreductase [Hansschlegelia zhihuaiae]|uniref:Glucose 1-dehydrogenase n=1 Tax=Hansschlegelia zhihuaiae TaxID=405005 RepID=A0A4Q0MP70_9HYPH|nr:glucose 1-dehydrogenase [Hansschlegelia zhihuaiae]RXF75600.1 glucose 1-dehydrogenase [Hansschlegelia zhihuaiae]
MGELSGKTAIVTGASKGIGAGIAKGFGAAGARVVVNYASDKAGAEKVVAEIKAAGGEAIAAQADMSKAADVKRLFEESDNAFGKLDVLVNNAGVYQFAPIEEITEEQYRRQFDVNVLGPILALQEAAKRFGPEGGSVINVSSVAAFAVTPTASVYSSTKAALDHLTRHFAAELGPRKIRVNSLNPGATETEGFHATGIAGTEFAKQMVAATPLGRLGQPEDIAKAAVFLASDASSWITGDSLMASGGQR